MKKAGAQPPNARAQQGPGQHIQRVMHPHVHLAVGNSCCPYDEKPGIITKKRAQGKELVNYDEILYEGYGPHGVAILVETATDNHVRTVANVKSLFNKGHGVMGNSGSVAFQFKKMGVFKLKPQGLSAEELELELIDFGLEELGESVAENGDEILVVRCGFTDFGNMQKALEEKNIPTISAEVEWIPTTTVPMNDEQAEDVSKLIERLEQDEDVQKVFHNMG